MTPRDIQLYVHRDYYQIGGNSHVVVWKPKGEVIVETPEMGLRAGIEATAMRCFSLNEKTSELVLEFLQSGKPNRINIGIVANPKEAASWIKSVNRFYKH